MILLWGLDADRPLHLVHRRLRERRVPHAFFDHAEILSAELVPGLDGAGAGTDLADAELRLRGRHYRLGDFEAAYFRPYDMRDFPEVAALPPGDPRLHRAAAVEEVLWTWADTAAIRMLNRPTAMQSNGSKPYQAALIAAQGFRVPDTLLTTDATALAGFRERHPHGVVYKSISGQRSIVQRIGAEHAARLQDLRWCPTQFQQWVPGTDYRIHTIGEHCYGTRIEAETHTDDYRYGSASYTPWEVPGELAQRCLALAQSLGLALAGIDLRLTPDGEWVCFEVNPSPAYSCYEDATGIPISSAIAAWLAAGDRTGAATPPHAHTVKT
jgi:hypothetical protein